MGLLQHLSYQAELERMRQSPEVVLGVGGSRGPHPRGQENPSQATAVQSCVLLSSRLSWKPSAPGHFGLIIAPSLI